MSIKNLSAMVGLIIISGSCYDSAQAAPQGVIHFHGNIVESGCVSNAPNGPLFELTVCPFASSGKRITVYHAPSFPSAQKVGDPSARIVLLADTANGAYYHDQRYQLVDYFGEPIQSGAYVVTVNLP